MRSETDLDESGIKHYWGDSARQLLVFGGIVILVGSQFLQISTFTVAPVGVIIALVMVGFAALTNPRQRWVIIVDAALAGIGVVMFGGWGLLGYDALAVMQTVVRVALALVFLSAFYFSMKTLRAMSLNQIDMAEDQRPVRNLQETKEEELSEESMEQLLDEHGGHMPVGDITDDAPKEEFDND